MSRSPRYMQDAVIAMAIIVVGLALWRLHSHPGQWGRIGSWAGTNIFGPATLKFFPGSGTGAGASTPTAGPVAQPPPGTTNTPPSSQTNEIAFEPILQPPTPSNTNANVMAVTDPLVEESVTITARLDEAGAKGGDIQFSLSWDNPNDLDLHCMDPGGEEIWYSNKKSSRTGGELDVDQNAHGPFTSSPVENIYWPTNAAPRGQYRVSVVHYALHGGTDPTRFTVRAVVKGQTNYFRSTIVNTVKKEPKLVCVLLYDPANADPSRRVRFTTSPGSPP